MLLSDTFVHLVAIFFITSVSFGLLKKAQTIILKAAMSITVSIVVTDSLHSVFFFFASLLAVLLIVYRA